MSNANADIVTRIIEAYDNRDDETARKYVGTATKVTPVGTFTGWDEIAMFVGGFYSAFPDLKHQIVDVIADADRVATRVRISGTHTGPLVSPDGQEIPATGKSIDIPSHTLVKLKDGIVTDWYVSFDQMAMLGQLGLLPE
jgi:predicted ester cyclase